MRARDTGGSALAGAAVGVESRACLELELVRLAQRPDAYQCHVQVL
jgi:hypothetical protein